MTQRDPWSINESLTYAELPHRYREAASRLFPGVSGEFLNKWSLTRSDALVLGHFLEFLPHGAAVLDLDARAGLSSACFAAHPSVKSVTCISAVFSEEPEAPELARALFAALPEEKKKVRFLETGGDTVGIPALETPSAELPVAFVREVRDRRNVRETLEKVLGADPRFVFILSGCRGEAGPLVQAGIVDFMESSWPNLHFRLVGDLCPGLAASGLGLVFGDKSAATVEKALSTLDDTFSRRLDPLRLLDREEELVRIVNEHRTRLEATLEEMKALKEKDARLSGRERDKLKKENSYLSKEVSRLRRQEAALAAHYASRRYRLADAVAEYALRILPVRKASKQENRL